MIFLKNTFKKPSFITLLPYLLLTTIFIVIPLLIILIISLTAQGDGQTINDNFNWIGSFIWNKLLFTIGIAIVSTLIILIVGFPFGFFLSRSKSKSMRIISLVLISSPIWLSLLIKVIGIKLLFDSSNGQLNSTFGNIYTIITLVYLNLPIFILAVYNVVDNLPENLLSASKDLGRNNFETFFLVVVPYAKQGIFAGLFLSFVTCIGATGITSFVNLSNDGQLIGDIILDLGQTGLSNNIALARISGLCFVIATIILGGFLFLYFIPKRIYLYKKSKKLIKENKTINYLIGVRKNVK